MSRVRSFSKTPPAIAPESCPPCPGSSMTSAKGSTFLCWGTTSRGENGSGVRRRVKNDTIINKRPSHTIISLALVETRKRTILFRDQRCQFIRFHGTISHRHVCITLQHRRRNCPISKSLAPLPPDLIVSRHGIVRFQLPDQPAIQCEVKGFRQIFATAILFAQKFDHSL